MEAASKQSNETAGEVWKTLWKLNKKGDSQAAEVKMFFMAELFEALFTEQRRWVRDPKTIHRGYHNSNSGNLGSSRRTMLCFNCEHPGRALRTGEMPKDHDKIKRNFILWKQRTGLDTGVSVIHTAKYIAHAEIDE